MKFESIIEFSTRFEVKKMCEVLGVNRSSYYRWLKGQKKREEKRSRPIFCNLAMSWKAALNHGSARKEKGEARERKRTGSGRKREKKRKGERMREIAFWRIKEKCKNIVVSEK